MCAITGWIGNLKVSQAERNVKKMSNALSHRGPDGAGITISDNVILAMRRLAIIDVDGGKQPLFTEDKNIAIVGNGEIYNYIELQKQLKKNGHKLATGSDIEVFAHLFEDLGWQAVSKLRGMFALALHDRLKKKVYFFRDRLGEKPFYYTKIDDNIYFASELKALLKIPINKKLSLQSIDDFFHLYYVPEPNTPFEHIKKLEAGCVLEIDCETLKIEIHKYWSLENIISKKTHDVVLEIKDLFDYSCKITLRSDVPVAVSLSSGIDSSAIAAVSKRHNPNNLIALTVGYYNAKKVDERVEASELAKTLKMRHIVNEMDDKTIVSDFPKLVWDCDDLFAEISMFNINAIYKLAKEYKIKVLLSGIGGDELFWGYPWFRRAALFTLRKWKNKERLFVKSMSKLLPDIIKKPKIFITHLGWLNLFFSPKKQIIMTDLRPPFRSGEWIISRFYHSEFSKKINTKIRYNFLQYTGENNQKSVLRYMITLLAKRWLSSHVIAINDRLSMANGVEVRLPLLDYKLVETIFSNQQSINAYNKPGKYYFKKSLKGIISGNIMNRPKKGFTPPVARWLLKIILNYSYLLDNGFVAKEKIINPKLLYLVKGMILFPWTWYSLFQIIVLEVWGREFVWGQKIKEIKPKYNQATIS